VVDDDAAEEVRTELSAFVDDQGTDFEVEIAITADQAIAQLTDEPFDVAVVDMCMPEPSGADTEAGLRVVEAIRSQNLGTQAIILTGHATNENTVRAMESGAFSYVEKSSEGWRILPLKVRLAAERKQWRQERMEAERRGMLALAIQEIVHDMGNTLAPIRGFTALALDRTQAAATELQEYLDYVRIGAEQLDGMKEDILTVSGTSSATLHRHLIELGDNLRQRAAFWAESCRQRTCGFRLELDCSGEVWVDAPRLLRAVENLIGNAARAVRERWGTKQGGIVTLCVTRADGRLRITVQDNGCGMSPETRDRILEPDSYGEHVRGHGIGLHASIRTITLHGGTIAVESEEGLGTTFTIDLPDHEQS